MKTQETLEFNNTGLELLVFVGLSIDLFLGFLPVLGKMTVVLQNGILDGIGLHQGFLLVFLGIHLNPGDLGAVGPPLSFSVVRL